MRSLRPQQIRFTMYELGRLKRGEIGSGAFNDSSRLYSGREDPESSKNSLICGVSY